MIWVVLLIYAFIILGMYLTGNLVNSTNLFIQLFLYQKSFYDIFIGDIFGNALSLAGGIASLAFMAVSVYGMFTQKRASILLGFAGIITTNVATMLTPIITLLPDPIGLITWGLLNFVLIASLLDYMLGGGDFS